MNEPTATGRAALADFYGGTDSFDEYLYESARPLHNHSYLAPAVLRALGPAAGRTLLDLGCGNGALTARLADVGFQVTGAESSSSGLDIARRSHPGLAFVDHDIADALPAEHRQAYDVVLAAEVIEHLFLPRQLFERATEAVAPGGRLVVTTPFHGYWKNLALAATNKFDHHWRPSWDYGHIKFFSCRTLGAMATELGWRPVAWHRIGRVPQLAKSMIMVAERVGD